MRSKEVIKGLEGQGQRVRDLKWVLNKFVGIGMIALERC